ncbi:metallophosphoesterase family protein [Baekduia sp. Peel2402]|uniref:metallophosphoesterase family protein n=1 Tax=Baekduia sp. Peel2402 TaxID=3458296 RepID=UPI00403E5CAD
MRILALYDIHGNAEALDAVLADPRAAAPDAIVVGGDVVPGRFAQEALERLAGLDVPTHYVRGNGERESGDPTLLAWPTTVELDGILFCHATPRDDEELLTRISAPERWAAALAGVTQPLVVAGHTHQQDDRTVGAVRFVNAGSVGLPYEGDPGDARWLWIEDGVPHLRRTAYDAIGAGQRLLDGGDLDDSLHASLIAPVPAIEVTELFEARAAQRSTRETG